MLFYEYRLRPAAGWEGPLPENPPPDHWRHHSQDIILFAEQDGPDLLFCQVSRTLDRALDDFRAYCARQEIPIGLLRRTELTAAELDLLLRRSDRINHTRMLEEHGAMGYLPFLSETPQYEWMADFEQYRTDEIRLAKATRCRCQGLRDEIAAIHTAKTTGRKVYAITASERTIRDRVELLMAALHSQGQLRSGRVCVVRPLSMQMPVKTLCLLYREQRDASVLVMLDQKESEKPFLDSMTFFRLGALAEQYSQSVSTFFAVTPQTQELIEMIERGLASVKLMRLGWEKAPALPPSTAPASPKPRNRAAPKKKEATPSVSALEELNRLIGLEEAKKTLTQMVEYAQAQKLFAARGVKFPQLSMHLVFAGNPGTGKTSVARLAGRIFQEAGILSRGHLVEADRSTLVAGYVGQTAIKTRKIIDKALGGVLFIDEAYTLSSNEANDFGQEAMDVLLKAMEDCRDNLVVILAGYEGPIKELLSRNPGANSRFPFWISFPDYTEQELLQVMHLLLEQNDRHIRPQDEEVVRERLCQTMRQEPVSGNARHVRNFVDQALLAQGSRLIRLPPEQLTDEDIRLLRPEDFPRPEKSLRTRALPQRSIGFHCPEQR